MSFKLIVYEPIKIVLIVHIIATLISKTLYILSSIYITHVFKYTTILWSILNSTFKMYEWNKPVKESQISHDLT